MKRRLWIQGTAASIYPAMAHSEETPVLTITLHRDDPSQSRGVLNTGESFPVGYGRDGYLPEGASFRGGSSLLGDFQVNAVLSGGRFEMTDALIEQSGKSREWLEENLFANMSSIDFDGDGSGGEYGEAFIGLEPLNSEAEQPFHFGEYKGVFRWYSYAIHGTQNEERIGKCITGGCINVGAEDLESLVSKIQVGDFVRVTSQD
ncbi:MAG: L,D-transpeptidase [Verrucomicrobiota bacterium]